MTGRLALTALAAACTADGAGWNDAVVRDSAGVEIVENVDREPPADRIWTLVQPPIARIGSGDARDPAGLYRVVGARRLDDGRIAIANAGTSEIKFFAPDGRFVGAVGGDGSGPGEYRGIAGLLRLAPDSLLVYDGRLERFTVLDAGGDDARTFHFDYDIDPILVPVAALNDGGILAFRATHMTGLAHTGINVDSALIVRFDATGEFVDSLDRFEQNWRYVKRTGALQTTLGVPFAPHGAIVFNGEQYCHGMTDRYDIACRDTSGSLRRIIRLDHEPVPITAAMVDRYFEDAFATAADNARRALARLQDELPVPEHLPAFATMMLDAAGNLWVREYAAPSGAADPGIWRVFDPSGRMHARAVTPAGLVPLEIGQDYVLGRWLDELDVEHVVVHCLAKGGDARRECAATR